jgi:AcrR family transcriptional regulator
VPPGLAGPGFVTAGVSPGPVVAGYTRDHQDDDRERHRQNDSAGDLHPPRHADYLWVRAGLFSGRDVRHGGSFGLSWVSCLYETDCSVWDTAYTIRSVPKLWDETIEAHRAAVREAALDAVAELLAAHGLRAVTMSEIAERTGIGRATLYKYFPDVEAMLVAWHERQVGRHLDLLEEVRDQADPAKRLEEVLAAYAQLATERPAGEPAAHLHSGDHVAHAQTYLRDLFAALIEDGMGAGDIRADVSAQELAVYCLHSLAAASTLPSRAAVGRLVAVTLSGMRP